MQVRIDQEADALSIHLTDHGIKDSEEVTDGVIVDYDATGNVVSVEILDASQKTGDPNTLRQFSFDLPRLVA